MNKKLGITLLTAILISGCGIDVQTTDKTLTSLSQEEITVLDKEYSFQTKALSANYLKKKLIALIGSDNGITNAVKIIKELEYARIKEEAVIPFKAMIAADTDFYTTLTGVSAVINKRAQSGPFDLFISGADPNPAPDNVIYVNNALTTGNNDGTSWENAFRDTESLTLPALQRALDAAATGKQIWVAAGTYKPTKDTNDRYKSFNLKAGVKIYGGFAGNERSLSQRTPSLTDYVTILSGDIADNDTDINPATSTTKADNVFHVVKGNNNTLLEGVTVKYGYAAGSSSYGSGGGLYNYETSTKLENVTFSHNYASNSGGAISMYSYSMKLTNVNFYNNVAYSGGAAIYISRSSPELKNVIFSGNSVISGSGGAIYNEIGAPEIKNAVFTGNSSNLQGGAIYNGNGSDPTIINATFYNNTSPNGKDMYSINGSDPSIRNSIFWGNSSNTIYQIHGILKIEHSIFQNGINSIATSSGGTVQNFSGANLSISTFEILSNNLTSDPLFISPANLALQPDSPAINAGTNTDAPATDIIGTVRGTSIDIGAYEFVE